MYNLFHRPKALEIIVGIIITLIGVSILILNFYTKDNRLIAPGITLEIPLGNLRLEKAQSELEQIKTKNLTRTVHFTTEDNKDFSMSIQELGLSCNYGSELQQAYQIGRQGNILQKAFHKFRASMGITFKLQYHWNDQILEASLYKAFSSLNIPAENVSFSVTSEGVIEIIPEKYGKEVDIHSLITTVKQLPYNQVQSILIPFKVKKPDILKADLENLKMTELGSYTTHFNPGQLGRTQNIELATQAINGTILKPGEVFSFNQIVGPRTTESGYQTALIIEKDKFVPGLGGGICQVSSTLYNAVEQASLSIIERSHHSLAVTYVPQGQDATVAYPSLDFKFENNSGSYLLIHSSITENTLTFCLYGKEKSSH